jgi:flavin-dependent dehydrogenase
MNVKIERNFWNISRLEFDNWLLHSLTDTKFYPLTTLKNYSVNKKEIEIVIKNGEANRKIKAKYLIGADGANSTVRNILTSESLQPNIRKYTTKQIFVRGELKDWNYTKFIYDNEITDFYSWVIPKGRYILLGSALEPDTANEKFKLFLDRLKKKENIGGVTVKKEAAMITRISSEKDIFLGSSRIAMVGESAGLISPSTGEGISFAMRSGYNCAHVINNNFDDGIKEKYKKACKPLISEIKGKIQKSEILSKQLTRKEWLNKISK